MSPVITLSESYAKIVIISESRRSIKEYFGQYFNKPFGFVNDLKSASNLNDNLNCSKELEHYAS